MENDGNCSYHFGDLSDHRVVCLEQLKGERNDGIFLILRLNKSVGSVKSMEKSDIFTAGSIIPGPVEPSPMIGGALEE